MGGALFYVNDTFELYWLSDPQTRHSQNIARGPRIAIAIHEDYRDWRVFQGIQMEGTAEEIGPPIQAIRPMGLYAVKYPFLGGWRDPPPVLANALGAARVNRFVPARGLFIDNARGFGHRQELTLPSR